MGLRVQESGVMEVAWVYSALSVISEPLVLVSGLGFRGLGLRDVEGFGLKELQPGAAMGWQRQARTGVIT